MIVMKFGGTSVGGVEPIRRVVRIVTSKRTKQPVVVVSAMSKVTDTLYRIATAAQKGDVVSLEESLQELKKRHTSTAEELFTNNADVLRNAKGRIHELCDELAMFCRAVFALGELSPRSQATIVSYGELLSSSLVGMAMNAAGLKTCWVDAREMMITDDNRLQGKPNLEEIAMRVPRVIEHALEDNEAIITQGFIASMKNGEATILGRGGSDYSASLIGMALEAETIEIWTDVDGILTTDPRIVSEAHTLEKVSYEEAAEMANFGAKVLHPMTMEPAVMKHIPIRVLNSLAPENPGTYVLPENQIAPGVKSISCKDHIVVVNIFSMEMVDTAGFLMRVFGIFAKHNVSVDLIATSEANISLTVDSKQKIEKVRKELEAFAQVTIHTDKAQVSMVGKELSKTTGLMRRAFAEWDDIPVYMVSRDAADISLSVVVDKENMKEAVKRMHNQLFV